MSVSRNKNGQASGITEKEHLHDILECISRIEVYTSYGRQRFMTEELIQDAVFHNLEIIGEAAGSLSFETQKLAPEIPWLRIASFRGCIGPQIAEEKKSELWVVFVCYLPVLKSAVERIQMVL